MSPTGATEAARQLVGEPNRQLGSTRLLAAALLLRQELEEALDRHWERTVPGLAQVSGRAQLISLPFYAERRLASDVAYAWSRLSAICHHDAYELPPGPQELERLADVVDALSRAGWNPIDAIVV